MRAVVLVGGEGTRLRPLTFHTPKQMLPVAQLPMIERVLEQLSRHGVDSFVLSLGYKPEVFTEHFSSGKWRDIPLTFAIEPPTLLDTAGAIGFAARHGEIDDTFVAVNGDVLSDLDVSALLELHRARNAQATIALTPVQDPSAFGVVPTDADGRVQAFIEKPKREDAPTNLINAGTYILEPSVLDLIPEGERVSIERQTFPALVERGSLYARGSDAYWLDTGTVDKYIQANLDYLRGIRPLPPLPDAVERERNWFVGQSSVAGELETTLVGAGVVIAEGASVRRSIIGPGSVIEAGAVLDGAVLLGNNQVGAGAVVRDSVLGDLAKVQADAHVLEHSVLGRGDVVESGTQLIATRIGV